MTRLRRTHRLLVAAALAASPVAALPVDGTAQAGVADRSPATDTLLWHRGDRLSPAGMTAIRLLTTAGEEGLDPAWYDAARLDSLSRHHSLESAERHDFDRLLTSEFTRYLAHLAGRSAPDAGRLSIQLRTAVAADSVSRLAAALEPGLVQYRLLKRELARYRALAADTSLRPLPAGRTVKPGDTYGERAALAHLLHAIGDLSASAPGDSVYDGAPAAAVARFQERHGLEADSILGPATFRALNTPMRARVRQLELAMERLRRLPPITTSRVVAVNVPAFLLFAFDSAGSVGSPGLVTRAIVGRAVSTRTPTLFGELRSVEFWPHWNVPRSILVNEILPLLGRQPDYLRRHHMELVNRSDVVEGDAVSPGVLDRLGRGELRIRQRPGPWNALGAVKFVFPNPADVYIHGTPDPELFERARRDLSHGCIRVERYGQLATWVLGGQAGWTADSTAAAIDAGRPRRVAVTRAVAVAVVYTTAAVDPRGWTYFHEDLYRLDPTLDAELRRRDR